MGGGIKENRVKLRNIGALVIASLGLAAGLHFNQERPSSPMVDSATPIAGSDLRGVLNRLDSFLPTPTATEVLGNFSHESLLADREGFGAQTTGGQGGPLLTVTSLDDDPTNPTPGTLRWALQQEGPAIVRFAPDLNGTIALVENILVGSNKTLDGRGNAITLTQSGLNIKDRENIIIANISLTDGFTEDEHTFADEEGAGDAINVSNSKNVWIHHVSASKYYDGLIDIINGSNGITVSWSELSEHNKAVLIGNDPNKSGDKITTVTMHHNVFRHLEQRMPRVRFGKVDLYNNYYTDWDDYVIGVTMDGQAIVENNIFEPGPETGEDRKRVIVEDVGDDTREGLARVSGNLELNGSIVESTAAYDRVFTRPYAAHIDTADTLLKDSLLAGAGAN